MFHCFLLLNLFDKFEYLSLSNYGNDEKKQGIFVCTIYINIQILNIGSGKGQSLSNILKNLSKNDYKIIFSTNFGRDIEYYTGMVFDIWASTKKNKQEIARGGRYDGLLKSLGSKKNISAVGAAINLNNLQT